MFPIDPTPKKLNKVNSSSLTVAEFVKGRKDLSNMPHVSAGSSGSSSSDRMRSDDPNDCDEVKVFKCAEDEGELEKEDVINDDKRDLIRATECDQGRKSPSYSSGGSGHSSSYSSSGKNGHGFRSDPSSIFAKSLEGVPHPSAINMGYLMPYPYPNGSPLGSMSLKNIGLGAGSLPFFVNGVDGLTQPPPAHMGIPPYHHLDPSKGVHGLSRSPIYPFGGQYPYSVLPEASQVASWHASNMYHSISQAGNPGASASGFRNYPPTLSIPPTSIPSDFYRFPPGSLLQGAGSLGHHLSGVSSKHDDHSHSSQNHNRSSSDSKSNHDSHGTKNSDSGQSINSQNEKKKPHIKKPLNAFMLYMKEMRAKVVAECTLKESAAINQILGRRWHSLSREEQAKYYEKARQERQLHLQLYPGWSARDNYGYGAKKKKRKKEKTSDGGREEQAKYYELARRERQRHMQMYPNWSSAQTRTHHEKKRKKKQEKFDGGNSMKKCRARYGLDQQAQWCKPCRRKKKCIRYMEGENGDGGRIGSPDDNLGSVGSGGDALTPDSKTGMDSDMDCGKSSDMGMSSPNFSITSPGMSLASPGMSLNSPGLSLPSPALTSPCPSGLLQSPASLASPAVSLPSLQSPMTPCLDDRHAISSVGSSASSSHKHTSNSHHSSNNIFTTNTSNHNSSSTTPSSSSSTSPPMSSLILGLHSTFHPNSNNSHHSHGREQNSSNPFGPLFGVNGGFPGLAGLGLNFKGPHRSPVGANPHDINNPLSVNQLTNNNNNHHHHHHHHHSSSSIKRNSGNSSSNSLSSKNAKNSSSSAENGNTVPTVIGVS